MALNDFEFDLQSTGDYDFVGKFIDFLIEMIWAPNQSTKAEEQNGHVDIIQVLLNCFLKHNHEAFDGVGGIGVEGDDATKDTVEGAIVLTERQAKLKILKEAQESFACSFEYLVHEILSRINN